MRIQVVGRGLVPQGALIGGSCLGSNHHALRFEAISTRGSQMIRKFALALALAFTASLIVQIAAASQAFAQKKPCTYTSSDKKKGYKC
jgi:uncharacterized membrane protein